MKVLQLGKFYHPYRGGIETVLKGLCEGLKSHVDLHVLVSNTVPRTVHEQCDFTITRVASWGTILSSSITPTLPQWVLRVSADLIHVHLPNPLAEMSCLIACRKMPIVAHFHSDIVRQKSMLKLYAPFLERFYSIAACIIVPTPNHISISPFVRRFHKKCHVVPYGITLEQFDLTEPLRRKRDRLRGQKSIILFTGRLVYYKGLEYLLKAMLAIDAELWIIGAGTLERWLQEMSQHLGLQEKVQFLGEISEEDLPAYYHAADVFVLPSVENSEMFGMVLLEAMACKKPVVCTDLPTGVSWVNQHGVTGLRVPPRSPQGLADAINMLLRNDSLRAEMGEAGRRRVESDFTSAKMAERVFEIYKDVIR